MKTKMVISKLFQIQMVINELAQVKGTCKFAYAIAKNKKLVDDETALIRKSLEPSSALISYEKRRVSLCEKHCEKDEFGKPVIIANGYQGLENSVEFKEDLEKLREEFADTLKERADQSNSFNKMVAEEGEFEFWSIKLADIPDGVTAEQLDILMPIIEA